MASASERRLVTSVFVDVVGSTETMARLGPERMRRVLDEAFAEMSAKIADRGGVVEKYVGDAIFALFGAPIAHADDPERALRAADQCVRWSSQETAGRSRPAVRIGIETGEALVDLGAVEHRQRMAVGENINLAARLVQIANPGEILVGPVCRQATAAVAEYEPAGAPELKGLGHVEVARFVEFRRVEPTRVPFVGREPELEALREATERALGGTAALALIVGPPGQGKSRLAAEAVRRCGAVRLLEARCRPGTESGMSTPLHQLVTADLTDPSPESLRDRLGDLVGADDGAEVAAAVAHSAGLAVDKRLLPLTRLEQRELIAGAWRRYLDALSRHAGGLVVVLEDLHWADPVLVRIVDRVSTDLQTPLFVIATTRPEFAGTAYLRPSETRLELDLAPLDEEASALLAQSVGGSQADTSRAGGNPLFIIELARARSGRGETPVTIQAAIAARLDELPPAERELLQLTSVIGETFDIRDAALLTEREPAEVASLLGRVAHVGFVELAGSHYRFHHALVRDVAYGRLPIPQRRELHARYAVDGLDPADVEGLAHHWWQALQPPDAEWVWDDAATLREMRSQAYAAHMAAGRRLEQRNASEESLDVFIRAVQLADDAADIARAHAAVGKAHARQGRGDEAWEQRLRAIDGFRRAGLQPPAELYADMLEIAGWNWGYFQVVPDDADVMRLLDDGERRARETGDDVSLARLLIQRAAITEDPAGADAIAPFVESPDAMRFADAAHRAAELHLLGGRITLSVELYRTVIERLLPAGAIINEPEALLWYGLATLHGGDLEGAEALADRLRDEAARRSPHTRQHALGLLGLINLVRGAWDDVAATSRILTELMEANPDTSFCLIGAATGTYGAIAEIVAGGELPESLDLLVARTNPQSALIQASAVMLPKVMVGDSEALGRGLGAYVSGLRLVDRQRQWDVCDLMPAIAMTMLERWDELRSPLARLDRFAQGGGRLAEAVASAIREEEAATRGGSAPAHTHLRALGFSGISTLLRFRPTSAAERRKARQRP